MKTTLIFLQFILLSIVVSAQSGSVKVTINNLNTSKKGNVQIAIYNSGKNFLSDGQEFRGKILKVSGPAVSHTFHNIPKGKYAIAVFQDYNQNNKLDKNVFGAPTERYGFSNNVYGKFSAPDFEKVSFHVNQGKVIHLTIRIQ